MGKPATIPKPITRATPARRGPCRASSGVGLTEVPGHVLTPVQLMVSPASTDLSQVNAPAGEAAATSGVEVIHAMKRLQRFSPQNGLCHPPHRGPRQDWMVRSPWHSNQEPVLPAPRL